MEFHSLQMELNRVTHIRLDFLHGLTGRDASVEHPDVRTEVGTSISDYDGALGHRDIFSSPACLTMLARVILAASSPTAPGTVTQPSFAT